MIPILSTVLIGAAIYGLIIGLIKCRNCRRRYMELLQELQDSEILDQLEKIEANPSLTRKARKILDSHKLDLEKRTPA